MVRFAGFSLMYSAAWPLVYALHVLAHLLLALLFTYFFDYFSANIILLHFRCKCGNCKVALLQNISECYCCCELQGCEESIKSDLVLQDLAPDVNLTCITEHLGFQPVCLQKWSLRLAADKFKTKGKERYRQTGSEERWAIFTTALVGVITFRVYQNISRPSFQIMKFEIVPFLQWRKKYPMFERRLLSSVVWLCWESRGNRHRNPTTDSEGCIIISY